MVSRMKNASKHVKIGLVGKYVDLHDAYLSVSEALHHAGIANDAQIDLNWIASDSITDEAAESILSSMDGIIVPGGSGDRGTEAIIAACRYARKHQKPCLMIGFGMQLAVVEAVRDLLGEPGANSTEVTHNACPAVVRIPDDRIGDNDSRQNSRQGGFDVKLSDGKLRAIYGQDCVHERHGNRYEVDPSVVPALNEHGMHFTAMCGEYPEGFEMDGHPFYIGVIYHPEYISRPNRPHPLFLAFIQASLAK